MEKGITREVTTILKAIAILTVIFTHANGKLAFVGVPLLCNSKFTSELCKGGMSTFLILSGYGLYCSYQKKGFDNWWDRKITKIFLPAILIQIVWFLLVSIYTYFSSKTITISWATLITDILCISQQNNIDGSMWYLSYLLFCYTVFYVF